MIYGFSHRHFHNFGVLGKELVGRKNKLSDHMALLDKYQPPELTILAHIIVDFAFSDET